MPEEVTKAAHVIYRGSIYHERLAPVRHVFTYPVFFFGFDIDRLGLLDKPASVRYNRSGLLSLRDSDHLDATSRSLPEKYRSFMTESAEVVILITVPRVMGYVFNPVSFYLGLDKAGHVTSALAEVNNTFHERHIYTLDQPLPSSDGYTLFKAAKTFHVSPFNDRLGQYIFRVRHTADSVEVHVDIERNGDVVFRSGITGRKAKPVTRTSVWLGVLRFPLQNLLTLPRIHWQALQLYFFKKLGYYPKPGPMSAMTIKTAPPTLIERFGKKLFCNLASRLRRGKLVMRYPDGSASVFGDPAGGHGAEIVIRDYTFFRRILLDGDIGLGEAYMYGQWDTPDLTALISLLIENRDELENGEFWTTRLKWLLHRISHRKRSNTKVKSRRNIQAHYDLSNDFFRLFLDPTMMYSSAVFQHPDQSLEDAQHNRMDILIRKLVVDHTHHVLEIGSGWGGFAIEMARKTGCRVTSITISDEQLKLARERVHEAGLSERVQIVHCDYRDIAGRYDRVVSIEMLEAVGHEHFDAYFSSINRVLAPGGRAVLQVITMPAARYDAYLNSVDWIQKHIFPGGHIPCIEALEASMKRVSNLTITGAEDIGHHYATTLRRWSENLAARRDDLVAMGYDEIFYRKWQYYFSYCEAGFSTRALSDMHLVLERSS